MKNHYDFDLSKIQKKTSICSRSGLFCEFRQCFVALKSMLSFMDDLVFWNELKGHLTATGTIMDASELVFLILHCSVKRGWVVN